MSGELVVTDPATYEKPGDDEDDQNPFLRLFDPTVKNVKNGVWKVKYANGPQDRIQEIIAYHETVKFEDLKWSEEADGPNVGVDSGQAGIFDKKHC